MKDIFENIWDSIMVIVMFVLIVIVFLILAVYGVIDSLLRGLNWTFDLLCGWLNSIDGALLKIANYVIKKCRASKDPVVNDYFESMGLTDDESTNEVEPSAETEDSKIVN